eukprot:6045734-Pleurochrysis_carterae.AAC.2
MLKRFRSRIGLMTPASPWPGSARQALTTMGSLGDPKGGDDASSSGIKHHLESDAPSSEGNCDFARDTDSEFVKERMLFGGSREHPLRMHTTGKAKATLLDVFRQNPYPDETARRLISTNNHQVANFVQPMKFVALCRPIVSELWQ